MKPGKTHPTLPDGKKTRRKRRKKGKTQNEQKVYSQCTSRKSHKNLYIQMKSVRKRKQHLNVLFSKKLFKEKSQRKQVRTRKHVFSKEASWIISKEPKW